MANTYEFTYDEITLNDVEIYDPFEIDQRYTIKYNGVLFDGDTEGLNCHNFEKWEDAKQVYDFYNAEYDIQIDDNYYGVSFANGEWY